MAFRTTLIAAIAAMLTLGSGATAQMAGQGMHGHGHMQHDEVNMPGLRGKNATPEESAELAVMFRNFQSIERRVENLPDGIRAVTFSRDPEVMEVLVSHVVVGVMQPTVLDEEREAAVDATLGDEHALGTADIGLKPVGKG